MNRVTAKSLRMREGSPRWVVPNRRQFGRVAFYALLMGITSTLSLVMRLGIAKVLSDGPLVAVEGLSVFTGIVSMILFVVLIGPNWKAARDAAAVIAAYDLIAPADPSDFRYEFIRSADQPPSSVTQWYEVLIRRRFTVKSVECVPSGCGFTAKMQPIVLMAHTIIVQVNPVGEDASTIHVAIHPASRLPVYPMVDADGIGMLVVLLHELEGKPLVLPKLPWQVWRAVVDAARAGGLNAPAGGDER